MSGRPPKSYLQLVNEKNINHRTKAELEQRKKGEESLLTGVPLQEWPEVKSDPEAHKLFLRLRKLLKIIQRHDALHEGVINRYCLLTSECKGYENLSSQLLADIQELRELKQANEIDAMSYLDQKGKLQDRLMSLDRRLMEKRKMLLQIEKENIMTILGALRAVPKTPDKSQQKSKMADFLEKRNKQVK